LISGAVNGVLCFWNWERVKIVAESQQAVASSTGQGQSSTAWTAGIVAWLVPGGGHIFLGRWYRGLIIGLGIISMFALGLIFGGHLNSLANADPQNASAFLRVPPVIANFGTGVIYLVCSLFGIGFESKAVLPTSEYGNTFLWVAGLLNYLAALDAFDIGIGRKP